LKEDEEEVLVVVTRSQACRLKGSQLEQDGKETSSDSGEVVESVKASASDKSEVVGKAEGELVSTESEVEDRNSRWGGGGH